MDIKIKKAKLVKSGQLETTYIDSEGNEISLKGAYKCHQDLRRAFFALVPYFTDLTEQKEADEIDWSLPDSEQNGHLLRKIEVRGISIGGDESNRMVTLTGRRTLFTSRVLNINSPSVEMDSETFEWNHLDEFDIELKNLLYEVEEYIVNSKREADEPSLFDNIADASDDPFAEPTPTADAAPIEDSIDHVA